MIIRKYVYEINDMDKFIKENLGKKVKTSLDQSNNMSNDWIEGLLANSGTKIVEGRSKNGIRLDSSWNIDLYTDDENAWIEFESNEDNHNLTEHEFSSNEVLT